MQYNNQHLTQTVLRRTVYMHIRCKWWPLNDGNPPNHVHGPIEPVCQRPYCWEALRSTCQAGL